MNTSKDLVIAAARLARTAPESFKDFLTAFSAYTDRRISDCVSSSLDELPRAQGRAQTARDLRHDLANCIQMADQIESNRR